MSVPAALGDADERHAHLADNGVARHQQGTSQAVGAVAIFFVKGEPERVIDGRVVHHLLRAAIVTGVGRHHIVGGRGAESGVQILQKFEPVFKPLRTCAAEIVMGESGNAGAGGGRCHGHVGSAEECGALHILIEREKGGQNTLEAAFVTDDCANVRSFGGERRVLRMPGLHVELATLMGCFPTGAGAEDEQVAGQIGEARKVSPRERDPAGVLLNAGVGGVPGAVLGIEGIQMAGPAIEVDEDTGFRRITGTDAGTGNLRIGMRREQRRRSRAKQKVTPGEVFVAAAGVDSCLHCSAALNS